MDENGGAYAWYAVQTHARREEQARVFLSRRAIRTFLPRIIVRRRHGSRRWNSLEPLFPGYLFVHIQPDPNVVDSIRWTTGVRCLLGDDEAPISVPEQVVVHLQERVGERGYIVPSPWLVPQTRVRVRRGPFALLEGIVVRAAPRAERIRVLMELLHTQVSVDINLADLEAV